MSLKGRNTGLRFCVQSPLETARPAGTSSPSLRLVSNSTLRRLVLCEEISGTSQFWLPHAWEALKVQGSLTPMAPRHFLLGCWAQHNLQPDLLTWRSGAAPPTASSFLLKAVLARDWGQRNLGHWGYWSPGDSSYLISYSVTLLQNPFYNPCCTLLYPLLPCLSTWVLTSAMLEYLARLSSKKKKGAYVPVRKFTIYMFLIQRMCSIHIANNNNMQYSFVNSIHL